MTTGLARLSHRLAPTVLAVILVATGVLSRPSTAAADVDGTGAYLERLNQLREWAGLPAVAEDPALVADAEAAARWLVDNNQFTHDIQDPSAPAAAVRGARSNLYGSSAVDGLTPAGAINGWVNSFGHGMWALHPQLARTGYGFASNPNGNPFKWIGALNVIDGIDPTVDLGGDLPATFPANSVTGFDLLSGDLDRPVCPEAFGPTLRVIGGAERGDTFDGSSFRSVFVAVNGQLVPLCTAGGEQYDPLGYTDSTALVPEDSLPRGSRVEVGGEFRGEPLEWTFFTAGPIHPGRLCHPGISPFSDVPEGQVHEDAITCLAELGVIRGTAPGEFSPGSDLNRGQMASLVAALLDHIDVVLPDASADAFADDAGSVHEVSLNRLAAAGIFLGRADGTADATTPVSRAELAAYLERSFVFADLTAEPGPPVTFSDELGVHRASIERMAALGVIGGRADGSFGSVDTTTRAQAATLLARLGVLGTPGS